MAWDLKLRPAKEKAAARALVALLEGLEVVEVVPEVTLEALDAGELRDVCRLWTDN